MTPRAELKDPKKEQQGFRRRLALAGAVVLLLFAMLALRFFYLQVVRHEHYRTLAENNRIAVVPIVPNRGLILDRNGRTLAHNYSAYTLEITPSKAGNLEELINGLAEVVDISPKDRKRFKKLLDESKNFESLPIRTRLNDVELARFAAHRYRFPGASINARLFRHYPLGAATAHVVGYIGRINDKDLEDLEARGDKANYRGTDHMGKTGLEQGYEKELHGTTGFQEVEIDAGGRAVRILNRTSPVSGNNLLLSLDIRLQQAAEEAFGERRGALVAIDPVTGGVLAFVSKPGFDPNLFVDGIDPQSWDALNNSPDHPLTNRALQGQYPPGSTFKPFMALAGLASGKRTPEAAIHDPGFYVLGAGGHRYRDWKEGGHGVVDLHRSLVVSCDTYYYTLANDLGIDAIHRFIGRFGFGAKSGIDLEGEAVGVLPSQEWKQRRFKQKWYAGDTISVGIGQGYNLVTPLQLAQATALLAGDGAGFRPRLVRTIQDSQGGRLRPVPSERVESEWNPDHLARVKAALADVTRPGGTAAQAAAGAPYAFAGKTGTAQVIGMKGEKYVESRVRERYRDHAWFTAYAPADRPTIALAVLVENGGHGGSAAAPVARRVLDYYLLGKRAGASAPEAAEDENSGD